MKNIFCFFFVLQSTFCFSQQLSPDRPKLVVGIVVDQMRQEYLYRYYEKFGEGGFRKLMGEGFMMTNAHYNYVPTYTGPGHASVYTGTTPAVHGIIGNDWFDKDLKEEVNCVGDSSQKPVGSKGNGDVSPWRMLGTTVTDELKISTQKRSKIISLSIKDRGAVLPGGHMANGAYWYNGSNGEFITSTFYMNALPAWVTQFNNQKWADKYLSQTWSTLLPIDKYTESGPDDSPYEEIFKGKERPTFPYELKELRAKNGNYNFLPETPFGNDILNELAKTAIREEALGKNAVTDFLAVSFSSTDIVGHAFGPNSVEVEDLYLRLDKNITDLLTTLDNEVGAGRYTVFLTADHGVADVPQYLKDNQIPAGYFRPDTAVVNSFFRNAFPGKEIIEGRSNNQLYLNHGLFQGDPKSAGIDLLVATETIAKFAESLDGVAAAFTKGNLKQGAYDEEGLRGFVIRGYHAKRSGDLAIINEPSWTSSSSPQGTTHGSPYTYDTHVPMLFYGFGIKKGTSSVYHPITDIAPTISVLLRIAFPNGCTGNPIDEVFPK
jgi:predicted AlkP superfamily pyrophosphatase or phosphodiesterase